MSTHLTPSAVGAAAGAPERIALLDYDYPARSKEAVTTCNLCGSRRLVEVARTDRYGYPVPLRVCAECGLGFLSPRLTADEYAEFYARVYRPLVSAYHGYLIDARTVQEEQQLYAAGLLEFLSDALPRTPGSVMDIGGSTGVVAGVVSRRYGARATVLDPAQDELAEAAAAGLETVAGFAEDFDPGERTWDLVLLCQTIDHLFDVGATMESIRAMMSPTGFVYVDILDFSFVLRRRGQVEAAFKIDHPYYLTRGTALGYFAQSGLEVAAERLYDDGHWGFLLRAGEARPLDRPALLRSSARLLDEIWKRRARGA